MTVVAAAAALVALVPVAGAETVELAPPAHPLARWSFDEASAQTVVDSSGNGHHGRLRATKRGALPARVDAMVGQGIRFSAETGTDVVVKNHPRLNPTDGLTLTAWIRHHGPIGGTAEIVGKKGQAKYIVDGYRLLVSKIGRLVFEVGDGLAVSRVSTGRKTIRPDTWYYVSGTFSPGRMQLFLNGRLVAAGTCPPSASSRAPTTSSLATSPGVATPTRSMG